MTDLRSWLDPLLAEDLVVGVDQPVDPYAYECAAILKHLDTAGTRAPVLFHAPRTLRGSDSPYRLLFNLYADPRFTAASFGAPGLSWADLLERIVEHLGHDIPVERVDTAAVQEVVERDGEVDVRSLPFVRHVEMEGGPYFTPNVVSRGPSGRYNLSWNRCMYLDPTHVALHVSPRHLWSYMKESEDRGEPFPVAIVLGHHPAFQQSAASLIATERDEYEAAGGLIGSAVRVAPSVTFGDELLIPADAEVILEGEIVPRARSLEGPFGEYMQYLGPQKLSHVVQVRAITRRHDPYITEIFAAHADHLGACISVEASLMRAAKTAVPSVTGASCYHAGGPTTFVIAMRKLTDGLPMRAAMAVIAASNMIKQVIVVDDDVDPQNPKDVWWAVSTRTNADADITILKNLQGSLLDPSLGASISTSGFIIDATMPLDRPYPARAQVPSAALERHKLSNYVDETSLPAIESRVAAALGTRHGGGA